MPKPIHLGGLPVPNEHDHPTFQHWLRETFSNDDGREDARARLLRAENSRRFQNHLVRCPRAVRVS